MSYSEISFHFCEDYRIFREGVKDDQAITMANHANSKLQLIVKSSTIDRFEGAFIGSFINKFHKLIVKYSKREQLFGFSFVASINGFVGSSALVNCCIIRLISFIGLIQLVELIDYVCHNKELSKPLPRCNPHVI